MGVEEVHFSDLTGVRVPDPDQLAQINVIEHPDLEEGRRLEALPEELEQLGKLAIQPVTVEVIRPGEDAEPERYQLLAKDFGKLATGRAMSDVLEAAPLLAPPKNGKRPSGDNGVNYQTLDHAGEPHRGKITDRESRLVRDNLEAVNARLAAAGQRPIDPANPEHAKRYGFTA